ncbi:MAG: hypothetical protein RR357_02400 [Clostridia bacterium]
MDTITKAKINLYAVLRNLEDLCEMDSESKAIIKDIKLSVQFNVTDVGSATIKFENGKCTFYRGKKRAALKLYFVSPEHFNKLIDGEKTIPVFFNVFKAGFLLNQFTKLADRLSYYLKPTDVKLLENAEFFNINTTLTAYTAFFAMSEIANSDKIGKIIARRMPDGLISCGITDGPQVKLILKDHKMSSEKGLAAENEWRAKMIFADMKFAHDLLNGKTSSFIGMGTGQFQVKGYVEMLEQMAKLLTQVSYYLA